MAPEARGGECVIVYRIIKTCGEEIVRELSRLGKAIETYHNFKTDPPVSCKILEFVFVDEFFRDVGEVYTCIFATIERSDQVKVFYVEGEKLGTLSRENNVDE